MNKKYANILIILIFILGIVLYNFLFSSTNSNNSSLEKIKKLNISSIISKKTIDYSNHGIPYVVYDNGNDSIIIYREWESKIDIGDSIIKPKGSSMLVIKNTNKIQNLDYEEMKDLELPSP